MANNLPANVYPPTANIKLIHLPYSWIMWVQVFAIFVGMFGSLFYALLNHYDDVTKTMCQARDPVNWFPSFSSVIGNGFPELLIWRIGMLLLLPFRFWESILYHWIFTKKQQYMQKKVIPHYLGYDSPEINPPLLLENNNNNNSGNFDDVKNDTLKRSNNSYSVTNASITTNNLLDTELVNMSKNNPSNTMNPKARYLSFNNDLNISIQPVPTSQTVLSLLHSITMLLEYIGLTLLTFVSSKELFIIHEYGFVLYLVFSHLHIFLNFYLTRVAWSLSGPVFKLQCAKLGLYIVNILALYGVFYFYVRHNALCEDGIYSLFGLAEYTLVISNTTNHIIKSLQYTWEGRISFSLHIPTLALSHSDNAVVSHNHDVMYNKYYDQEGSFMDRYNNTENIDEMLLLTKKDNKSRNYHKKLGNSTTRFSHLNNGSNSGGYRDDDDSSGCEDHAVQFARSNQPHDNQQIIGLAEHGSNGSGRSYSSGNIDLDNIDDLEIL